MAALGAAFAESIFKFIIYLLVAALGVFAGMKLKSSKKKNSGGKDA